MRLRNFTPHELRIKLDDELTPVPPAVAGSTWAKRRHKYELRIPSEGVVRAVERDTGWTMHPVCLDGIPGDNPEIEAKRYMAGSVGVPVFAVLKEYVGFEGLPEESLHAGDVLVVSVVAAQAILGAVSRGKKALTPYMAPDVHSYFDEGDPDTWVHIATPDTGPESAIRDDQGRIIAVRRLVQVRWRDAAFERARKNMPSLREEWLRNMTDAAVRALNGSDEEYMQFVHEHLSKEGADLLGEAALQARSGGTLGSEAIRAIARAAVEMGCQ